MRQSLKYIAMLLAGICMMSLQAAEIGADLQSNIDNGDDKTLHVVWIYFADKGPNLDEQIAKAEAAMAPRALKRRARLNQKNMADRYDVPVYPQYLEQVRMEAGELRHPSRWLNAVSAEATALEIERIATLPFVEKVTIVRSGQRPQPELGEVLPPAPDFSARKSAVIDYGSSFTQNEQINVPLMHNLGHTGSGVLIAVLDAGFNNLEHPSLSHLNIVDEWDFVNNDGDVDDQLGQAGAGDHGILVLSALAGFAEGSLIGPAYGADYLLAKTENTDSERNIEEDHWVAAAEWADTHGADIISTSLGYRIFDNGQRSYTSADMDGESAASTIGAEVAASRGILVVTSAGNEGPAAPGENTLGAPADGATVLAVGAVTSAGARASFSSVGPTADGRIKPDVAAMGVAAVCASSISADYRTANGTSLSCPLVAGAAALVLEVNPNMSNVDLISALRNSASQSSSPDNLLGWGIIDVAKAAGIDQSTIPQTVEIYPAWPNPFNPRTNIRFGLDAEQNATLSVYNGIGQLVEQLWSGSAFAGQHQVVWEPENVATGVYYIVLQGETGVAARKVMLLK